MVPKRFPPLSVRRCFVVDCLWVLEAVGKRATEAVARSASEGTGWVSGVDSVLSGGDSDDYKDNDEDFINSIGYVEEGTVRYLNKKYSTRF